MTAIQEKVRRYDVAKDTQGAYRTWMDETGRFVFAASFETLVRGLLFVEWQASAPGLAVDVYVEFRSVVAEFSDGAPYALLGGPVGDKLEVHDLRLGVDAAAATMLDLERQVWQQVHLGRVECPPACGRIELVYRDGFKIDKGAQNAVTLHVGWKPAPADVSKPDVCGQAEIKRFDFSLLTKRKTRRKILANTGRSVRG